MEVLVLYEPQVRSLVSLEEFGMDGFLRLGVGSPPKTLRDGVAARLEELKAEHADLRS